MSCGGKEKLYLFNWCYYTPESVIELFEKEFNVKVVIDEFASNEDMFAKLRSGGGGYDIIFPSADYVSIMIQQDMLATIDPDRIPNVTRYLNPEISKFTGKFDEGNRYSIPYYFGAVGIMVNTQRVPNFERSWNIFERTDLAGRMIMLDDMREVMSAGILRWNARPDINTADPDIIHFTRNLINQFWKPNLLKWDSEAYGKAFANGDAWVIHGYPENVFEEIAGTPLEEYTVFFMPQEGGTVFLDSMVILKTSKRQDLAHQFINFIYRPDIYALFADEFRFPTEQIHTEAHNHTESIPMYSAADVLGGHIIIDVGTALDYYNEAWYNSIRVGN